MFLLNNWK